MTLQTHFIQLSCLSRNPSKVALIHPAGTLEQNQHHSKVIPALGKKGDNSTYQDICSSFNQAT